MTTYKAEYEITGNGINLIVNGQKRATIEGDVISFGFAELETFVNLTRRMNKAGVIDLQTIKEWASGEVVKQFGVYVSANEAQEGDLYQAVGTNRRVIAKTQQEAQAQLQSVMNFDELAEWFKTTGGQVKLVEEFLG